MKQNAASAATAVHTDVPTESALLPLYQGVELRWQTLGLAGGIVLFLVAHAVCNEQDDEIIRIISARKAIRKERQRYDENRKEESLGWPRHAWARTASGKTLATA